MAAAGLVEREHCPHDLREWYAIITDKGRATYERVLPEHNTKWENNSLAVFNDDEIDILNNLLLRPEEPTGEVKTKADLED